MLSVKQGGIKYHFWVFDMTLTEIEPRSPGPLANTLLIIPSAWSTNGMQYLFVHAYIYKYDRLHMIQ